MITEQIDLVALKKLAEGAKQLKSKLILMGEKLDTVTQERDKLVQQAQIKDAEFLREKESLKATQVSEIQSIKLGAQQEINNISQSSEEKYNKMVTHYESKLSETTTAYENKLLETITAYEEKLQQMNETLTEKNKCLTSELEQLKTNHEAIINRIRGLS